MPHFSHKELACPTSGEVRLHEGFGAALEALRVDYGHAMPLTSCCRSAAHNVALGGHPRSLHLIGNSSHGTDTCAVDVAMSDGRQRYLLVRCALELCWTVGIASNFIHLDRRTEFADLPQVIYHYRR